MDAFREENASNKEILATLVNKVKVCPCGKPCAFTLTHCNACGASLAEVPITFNDNVFMGFVYGIEKAKFPYKISMRAQTTELLCFDDMLSLSPCHMNAIPTTVYCPDLRYLFTDPARGLALVNSLYDICAKAAISQFWADDAARNRYFGGSPMPKSAADLMDVALCGMNYPPSMYQLHLQFIHPPLLPFQYAAAREENHFHYGRFFSLEYLQAALGLGDKAKMVINEYTDIQAIIDKMNALGVNYDSFQINCLRKCRRLQEKFKAWDEADFSSCVVNGKVFPRVGDNAPTSSDPAAMQVEDKKILQNYGRPYNEKGQPSGTFYKHAKHPGDLTMFAR
jgi:hypothetical protein